MGRKTKGVQMAQSEQYSWHLPGKTQGKQQKLNEDRWSTITDLKQH
jgi:hypothetical protein